MQHVQRRSARRKAAEHVNQFHVGDIVLAKLDMGVWWPAYVKDVKHKDVSVTFWNEEDIVMDFPGGKNVVPFMEGSNLVKNSLATLKKAKSCHIQKFSHDMCIARGEIQKKQRQESREKEDNVEAPNIPLPDKQAEGREEQDTMDCDRDEVEGSDEECSVGKDPDEGTADTTIQLPDKHVKGREGDTMDCDRDEVEGSDEECSVGKDPDEGTADTTIPLPDKHVEGREEQDTMDCDRDEVEGSDEECSVGKEPDEGTADTTIPLPDKHTEGREGDTMDCDRDEVEGSDEEYSVGKEPDEGTADATIPLPDKHAEGTEEQDTMKYDRDEVKGSDEECSVGKDPDEGTADTTIQLPDKHVKGREGDTMDCDRDEVEGSDEECSVGKDPDEGTADTTILLPDKHVEGREEQDTMDCDRDEVEGSDEECSVGKDPDEGTADTTIILPDKHVEGREGDTMDCDRDEVEGSDEECSVDPDEGTADTSLPDKHVKGRNKGVTIDFQAEAGKTVPVNKMKRRLKDSNFSKKKTGKVFKVCRVPPLQQTGKKRDLLAFLSKQSRHERVSSSDDEPSTNDDADYDPASSNSDDDATSTDEEVGAIFGYKKKKRKHIQRHDESFDTVLLQDSDDEPDCFIRSYKKKSTAQEKKADSNKNENAEMDRVEDSQSDTSEVIALPHDYPMLKCSVSKPVGAKKPMIASSEDGSDGYRDGSDEDDFINDDEVIRDKVDKGIYVMKVLKSQTTKTGKKKKLDRIYNSQYPCPFKCQGLKSNFSHHILAHKHRNEAEVKEIKKTEGKEKKRLIDLLRYKICNSHNEQVIQKKKGMIILGRRLNEGDDDDNFNIADFGPCPNCLQWLKLIILKRHQSKCPGISSNFASNSKQAIILQSNVLAGRVSEHASKALRDEVFTILRSDNIGTVAQQDPLIVALGCMWMTRNVGNKLMRKYYTSGVIRLAARLRLHLNDLKQLEEGPELGGYLVPEHFDLVVKAALLCSAQAAGDEEDLSTPSNAIKLSYDLKKMCNIQLAMAIKKGDKDLKEKCEEFHQLMNISWSNKLAKVTLDERKFNNKKPLPLPEDVQKLAIYNKEQLKSLDLMDKTYETYRRAAMLAEARLVLYNRRRVGELQAMTVSAFRNRITKVDDVATELMGELTELERKLVESLAVVEIRGKCGKCVPVIVPPEVMPVLLYLNTPHVRSEAGVNNNKYLFANNRAGVVRGSVAVATIAEEAGLSKPDRIRSSNMRKYMATMTQSFDLTGQQLEWVCDHMGHTMDVHRIHYRATSDILERTHVAKILMIQEMGLVGKFHGKALKDIPLEDILAELQGDAVASAQPDELQVDAVGDDDDEEMNIPDLLDADGDDDGFDDDEDDAVQLIRKDKKTDRNKSKSKTPRHHWTLEEEKELQRIFRKFFEDKTTPRFADVEKAIKRSKKKGGTIHKHKNENIKKKVWNMMKKID